MQKIQLDSHEYQIENNTGEQNNKHDMVAGGSMLTACNAVPSAKSKVADRGSQNGRRGLERGPLLGFWAL